MSAPATPISSAATRPRSLIFRNRFSNGSHLSLSSLRTMLPQYSVVDTLEESPASPLSEIATGFPSSPQSSSTMQPPRYSLLHARQSLLLNRRASTANSFEADDPLGAHEFRYVYPIRPKNPWATLHLHTRVTVPGSVQNQPRVPRFWSCVPLKGTVQLDLDTPQNIHQISITVRCHVCSSDR
jgi:hypothetical protein